MLVYTSGELDIILEKNGNKEPPMSELALFIGDSHIVLNKEGVEKLINKLKYAKMLMEKTK